MFNRIIASTTIENSLCVRQNKAKKTKLQKIRTCNQRKKTHTLFKKNDDENCICVVVENAFVA